MTTPNTTGPSAEKIKRYYISEVAPDVESRMRPSDIGDWVHHKDHLAALSRAREDARREALEDTLRACRAVMGRISTETRMDGWESYREEALDAAGDCIDAIRALIPNTPQGETKEKS